MSHIILSAQTDRTIKMFLEHPAHAVALIAPTGAGKSHAARHIAKHILALDDGSLDSYAYFRVTKPLDNVISVEQAREIVRYMALKTTGRRSIRRVVVIEDAHQLTIEAQNTLLKTIEEPPVDTVLILTVSDKTNLLPTILSRLQHIQIINPPEEAVRNHFANQGFDESSVRRAYLLSGGSVGLTKALLDNSTEHPAVLAIDQAKQLLQMDCYGRLALIDKLIKQKKLDDLLFAFSQIAQSGIRVAADSKNMTAAKRWHHILTQTQAAQTMLASNAQSKLVLTNLFVHI